MKSRKENKNENNDKKKQSDDESLHQGPSDTILMQIHIWSKTETVCIDHISCLVEETSIIVRRRGTRYYHNLDNLW